MIFNFIQTQFIILKTSSNDEGLGVAIALTFLFVMGMLVIKAFIDYRRDLVSERDNATHEDLGMKDIARVQAFADEVLSARSTYYTHLSDSGKTKFRKRLRMVMAQKEFYGKDGLKVTDEMVVLAASALVQLTFGLEGYFLPRFYKIYIYPTIFYNKLLESNLKGSTSPSGVIRFSWKHLEHGFENDHDGINLALHELAHALKISITKGEIDDEHTYHAQDRIKELGENYRTQVRVGQFVSLRKYAGSNDHEFMACAIEVFFENPEELYAELPDLYKALVDLLDQDPIDRLEDYKSPERVRSFSVKRAMRIKPESHYSYVQTMLIAGFLLCWIPIILINIYAQTSPIPVALFAATLFVLGVVFFYRKLVVSGYTDLNMFLTFLVMVWMSLTMGAGLALNYFVPVYSMTEVAMVNDAYITPEKKVRVLLNSSEVTSVAIDVSYWRQLKACENHCELLVKHHYGLFGIKVLDDVEVIDQQNLIQENQ